jgi:hypothetical protein
MSVTGGVGPQVNSFNTWESFQKLSGGFQALTIITVAVVTIFTLGIGSVFVFRALVNAFSKLNLQGEAAHERTANKAHQGALKNLIDKDKPLSTETEINLPKQESIASGKTEPSKKIEPTKRPMPKTMSPWKEFLRTQLAIQLEKIGLQFEESYENGDCFFDAVAYQLTHIYGDKQYTAKDVRVAISEHLKKAGSEDHQRYGKMHKGDVDSTYEHFCSEIHKSAEEFKDAGSPIWGNTLTAQIIADIYKIDVKVWSASLISITLLETLEGNMYEGFEYIEIQKANPEVCTILDDRTFHPHDKTGNGKSIQLAAIDRHTWGHWLPLLPM